ncbi:unnamed protein product [Prunus armeniaca]|uniref:MADS-box domain-containing protein n=1 Tax=Prunus armeniaca TaxID=36596 RepID=A0A6J5W1W3_PRUAR|nr:unnamed protein product [Prunus armeniaca]
MTRKKVKLAWITNDSARKTNFRIRKEGLLKKLSELGIFCDVSGFAIIYGPDETRSRLCGLQTQLRKNCSQGFRGYQK